MTCIDIVNMRFVLHTHRAYSIYSHALHRTYLCGPRHHQRGTLLFVLVVFILIVDHGHERGRKGAFGKYF